jgi:hypothetical protein
VTLGAGGVYVRGDPGVRRLYVPGEGVDGSAVPARLPEDG